ncbi:MAG: CXXX repeat peptide maturase [Bacteroides sp.]|nr:CXXX repeat peptide maturase [Bacteroides sp.]
MLKYLIVPLTKDAVSFCHYERSDDKSTVFDIPTLKKAIFFAMTENLNIQFLYPDYTISDEHKKIIDSIDHTSIVSSTCEDKQLTDNADVIVFDSWAVLIHYDFQKDKSYIIRSDKKHFFDNARFLNGILKKVDRIVVVITDPDNFSNEDFDLYAKILESLIPVIREEYKKGHMVHFNLLTDRIFLDSMNNCNAGYESITLAPDGNFYICPAFYLDGSDSVGDLDNGLNIKNSQLYRLDHAPICRICDAYQCRRCVWLNKQITLETNTPSRQQCVMAHIERNTSRSLLSLIREAGSFMMGKEISEIDYIDPFDVIIRNENK